MDKQLQELIIAIIAWCIAVLVILYRHQRLNMLIDDIKNIWFSSILCIIIAFTVYCWYSDNKKLKLASQKASVALLIAYLARLDMVFAAYFIIFIFAYYTKEDIV